MNTQMLTEDEELYIMWHTNTCTSCGDVGMDYGFYYVGGHTTCYAYCDSCIFFEKKTQEVKKF
jgi:hypothetical protein